MQYRHDHCVLFVQVWQDASFQKVCAVRGVGDYTLRKNSLAVGRQQMTRALLLVAAGTLAAVVLSVVAYYALEYYEVKIPMNRSK